MAGVPVVGGVLPRPRAVLVRFAPGGVLCVCGGRVAVFGLLVLRLAGRAALGAPNVSTSWRAARRALGVIAPVFVAAHTLARIVPGWR